MVEPIGGERRVVLTSACYPQLARPAGARRGIKSPVLGHWPVGLGQCFQARHEPEPVWATLFIVRLANNWFSIFFKLSRICKLLKAPFCSSKIYQTLDPDRMEDKEQLSFWKKVKIQERIWIKNSESKTTFEFGPNLLGIQTCLGKSDKFPKIFVCPDPLECEFRMTWLYGKIWSFPKSSIWLGLKINEKRVWIWIHTKESSISRIRYYLQGEALQITH
jgi:hypothetical protein